MTEKEPQIRWDGGGEAWVRETDGDHAQLHSTKPAAPGTPLRGLVALTHASFVRFKVQDCRKLEDGLFLIRGRWIDLSKGARQEVLELPTK